LNKFNILAFDTATNYENLCLNVNGEIVAHKKSFATVSHSSLLLKNIDEIFREIGITSGQIDAVAIPAGPGSFTGVRIGFSVAKAFCAIQNIPLITVSTTEALAASALTYAGNAEFIVPVIDARKKEVYSAVFAVEKHKILTRQTQDMAVSIEELYNIIFAKSKNVVFAGDYFYKNEFENQMPKFGLVAAELANYNTSIALANIAVQEMERGLPDAGLSAEPLYIRKSEAEIKFGK